MCERGWGRGKLKGFNEVRRGAAVVNLLPAAAAAQVRRGKGKGKHAVAAAAAAGGGASCGGMK